METDAPFPAPASSSNGDHGVHGHTERRAAATVLLDDGQSAWREWRAYRLGGLVALALLLQTVVLAWAVYHTGRVHAVVQVVQHDEQGRLVKIGVPMDLLEYQPQEGAIRDMLTTWVVKRHWRGDEASDVRARYDWRWLYLHTCGAARKQLAAAEKAEHPFQPGAKRVRVDIDSLPKTVEGYQVLWKATTTEPTHPEPKVQWWNTTFTVGRVAPATVADAAMNNLGLCVTWFDDEPRYGLGEK